MTSVNTQNSTMALKTLSPMPIKDTNLFPLENDDDDAMSDDSLHLHLSEDEEEEKVEKKDQDPVTEKLVAESEDDILNCVINKFDGTDGPSTETPPLEQLDEDKLLSDSEEGENIDKPTKNEEVAKDCSEVYHSSDKEEKGTETDEIKNCEKIESADNVAMDADIINNSVSDDKETSSVTESQSSVESEEKNKEAPPNPEEVKQEEANAEILKNQIMDTEDLLQIVDKETDENDKEPDENDKDSSGGNSPRSVDKNDSDEQGEETETDKNDTETETEKMDEEDDEELRKRVKAEDTVDIDENIPESDAELDKAYIRLAAGEDTEAISSDKVTEPTETTPVDKIDVTSVKELKMETSTCGDDVEEPKKIKDAITEMEITEESETLKEKEPDEKKEESLQEKDKGDSDTDSSSKTSKRSLSDSDAETVAKKIKLQTVEDTPNKPADKPKDKETVVAEVETTPPPPPPVKIIALNAIDEYLKIKTLKKLTYRDLEQIVLQKICEAICHKSEIGELRHQLGVQEQMIEMWRKESTQLNKQARDLEIVNKRLLHEVRLKNERDKPLVPVKITRSVGLQVRSDANMINNVMAPKRRVVRPQISNPQSTIAPAKQNRINASNRANTTSRVTTTANRTQTPVNKINTNNRTATKSTPANKTYPAASPMKKGVSPKTPNSLLSKALQTSVVGGGTITVPPLTPTNSSSNSTSLTPLTTPTLTAITIPTATNSMSASKTLTNVSTKSGKSSEPKVIDLTDEDDKKGNSTQGVRIVSTPVKAVVTNAGVVNPPRIMYVYNNQLHQGVLATDPTKPGAQKLMLKLNSNVIGQANGVLTAVPNGSAITVGNTALRAGQVQPVRLASPLTPLRNNSMSTKSVLRHPAPLPPPPPNQASQSSRKPVPPKPHLSIKRSNGGLILSWKMPYNLEIFEAIASYQLYAYQETTSPPSSEMWRKVGDVKALALPMACTLTQFADGNKYHFAVRAVDVNKRMGPFSDPEQILL